MSALKTTPDRLDRPADGTLLDHVFPALPTGVDWDLSRSREALRELGNPHLQYATVHVGGTNGKGSVASTVHSAVRAARPEMAERIGLYTSPHLCSVTERFQVGAEPVSEETLLQCAHEVRDVVERHGLTFFEAITVLGFHLFAREGAELVVAEVGLGGRLDATNVIEPVVTAITNVALDHAEYLGHSLTQIATEKAGIIKRRVPVVVAEPDAGLRELFRSIASDRESPFAALLPQEISDVRLEEVGTTFRMTTDEWGKLEVRTPLIGYHQAMNAALAVRVVERLPEEWRPDRERLLAGIASVWWPGRDQIALRDGTTWLFDVAHNTAGVESLVDTYDRLALPTPVAALVASLGDKEWESMLPPVLERVEHAVLTHSPVAPLGRRWPLDEVVERVAPAAERSGCRLETNEDFHDALARVGELGRGGTVVVTGSVYTVGGALRALGIPPWPTR